MDNQQGKITLGQNQFFLLAYFNTLESRFALSFLFLFIQYYYFEGDNKRVCLLLEL